MIHKKKGLQNECNLYEWRNVDNQIETREIYDRESYQVRVIRGKRKKLREISKLNWLNLNLQKTKTVDDTKLRMLNNEAYYMGRDYSQLWFWMWKTVQPHLMNVITSKLWKVLEMWKTVQPQFVKVEQIEEDL